MKTITQIIARSTEPSKEGHIIHYYIEGRLTDSQVHAFLKNKPCLLDYYQYEELLTIQEQAIINHNTGEHHA